MSIQIFVDQNQPGELSRIAKALLKAAGGDGSVVRLETFGDGPYFVVPDEVAAKAQLNEDSSKPNLDKNDAEPIPAKSASKKRKDRN